MLENTMYVIRFLFFIFSLLIITTMIKNLHAFNHRIKTIRVDRLEINHYVEDNVGPRSQVIAWDWDPSHCRFDVVEWCWLDDVSLPRQVNSLWYSRFVKSNTYVVDLVAPLFIETHTIEDREKINRRLVDGSLRRRLK